MSLNRVVGPLVLLLTTLLIATFGTNKLLPAAETAPLSWKQVQRIVQYVLRPSETYRDGDLISRRQAQQVLDLLRRARWSVSDREAILQRVLPESHVLVSQLRTPGGQRFMRSVASDKLIYDRLDRASEQTGGSQMIRDLVRLPDGHRYALNKRARAVPGLEELLPKTRSGKTRRIKDLSKPTGKIYTQAALLEQLKASYERDFDPRRRPTPPVNTIPR